MCRVALVSSLVALLACTTQSEVAPAPAAAVAPVAAPEVVEVDVPTTVGTADAPVLHVEAMTRTLWRIEEPVLTEIALELLAGRVACGPSQTGGCRLDAIPSDSVLLRLGFEAGDEVREVAGVAITDGASLRRAIHVARGEGVLAVVLRRGGETRTHRYRLRKLVPASPRNENKERGFDLLAEAIRVDGERVEIDRAALEFLVLGYGRDRKRTMQLLGIDETAEITVADGVVVGSSDDVIKALRAVGEGRSVRLEYVAPGPSPQPAAITIASRADAVEPELLTALRAYFPDEAGAPTFEPRVPPGELPEAEGLLGAYPGVTRVSDTTTTITRATVDALLADPAKLSTAARVVPSLDADGFKIYGIRAARTDRFSFAALGFRNGDLVTAINGQQLTDMSAALEIYTEVRKAKKVEVAVVRRGRPLTLTIEVVES
jgi:S1-C subfamily serine protease